MLRKNDAVISNKRVIKLHRYPAIAYNGGCRPDEDPADFIPHSATIRGVRIG